MLKNAYLLAKIGADTAENERNFAEICQKLATTLRVRRWTALHPEVRLSIFLLIFTKQTPASPGRVNTKEGLHRRRRVLVDAPDLEADDPVLHDLVEAAWVERFGRRGPNQTNYSDRSSVRILSNFRNFR